MGAQDALLERPAQRSAELGVLVRLDTVAAVTPVACQHPIARCITAGVKRAQPQRRDRVGAQRSDVAVVDDPRRRLPRMPGGEPPSQKLPYRHARRVEHREVGPVVRDELTSPRLGVLGVAAHGEGSLHAAACRGVSADDDPDLEDRPVSARGSSPSREQHDDEEQQERKAPSLCESPDPYS